MDGSVEEMIRKLEEAARGTFWDDIGCVLEFAELGKTIVSLEVKSRHLNGIGILHGGVHASLLDNAMGITAMLARPGDKVVTTNLNLHYLSPLKPGKVTVTAELIHQSRKILTVHGKIEDEQGNLGSWGIGSFRATGAEASS